MKRTIIIAEQPDDVDGALYALRHSVADLVEMRHGPMADRVVEEEKTIRASMSALQGLLDDIWNSRIAAE